MWWGWLVPQCIEQFVQISERVLTKTRVRWLLDKLFGWILTYVQDAKSNLFDISIVAIFLTVDDVNGRRSQKSVHCKCGQSIVHATLIPEIKSLFRL